MVNEPPYLRRLQAVQARLESNQAVIFSQPAEIQYLSGFSQFLLPYEREALLICTPSSVTLLQPHFLNLQKQSFLLYHVGISPQDLTSCIAKLQQLQTSLEVLYDPSSLLVIELTSLQSLSVKLTALSGRLLISTRMIKDEVEQSYLTQAAHITQRVVTEVLASLQSPVTEKELAHQIDHLFLQYQAEASAFPTIVAYGPHSALPHHQPSDRPLQDNEAILIDCGARYQGYCGDMTRTVWYGPQPADEFIKIKSIVDQAYAEGLNLVRQKCADKQPLLANAVDTRCRSIIGEAGYREQFIHTSGHSLGLEIHEPPSISSSSTQELQSDMVVTLEPGIYLPNQFGYRYENTLLLNGREVIELTNSTSFAT